MRSSPRGKPFALSALARPRRCPRYVFREVRKRQQNKGKVIKMISIRPLKTLKYSKPAQDYKQNRHAGLLSIRPLAASPSLTVYARSNFTFKSPAGIKIHTYKTSLNAPLGAIRPMFSLLWRAPCTCHLSPSWSLSRPSPTFALKPQWESKFHIVRHLFAL